MLVIALLLLAADRPFEPAVGTGQLPEGDRSPLVLPRPDPGIHTVTQIEGVIDESRLRAELDRLAGRDETAERVALELPADAVIDLTRPLSIPTGVFLRGDGSQTLRAARSMPAMIQFEDARWCGLIGVRVESRGLTRRAAVWMTAADADPDKRTVGVHLFDCVFVDEVAPQRAGRTRVPRTDPSGRMVEVGPNSGFVFIDGCRFEDCRTGVSLRSLNAAKVMVTACRFDRWRDFGVQVLRKTGEGSSPGDIRIANCRFGPPKPCDGVRKPIDFQSDAAAFAGDLPPVSGVQVRFNTLLGEPGTFHSRTAANAATADMITLHRVSDADIVGNRLENGGEVGINVARGSRDVRVVGNEVTATDGAGVNVGVPPKANETPPAAYLTRDVSVEGNTLRDVALNLGAASGEAGFPPWARSGVIVNFAHDVTVIGNRFLTTDRSRAFYPAAMKDARQKAATGRELPQNAAIPAIPRTLMQAVRVRNVPGEASVRLNGNTFALPPWAREVVREP